MESGCGEEGGSGEALVLVGCFGPVVCVEDAGCERSEREGWEVARESGSNV